MQYQLLKLRKEHNISQKGMAKLIGMHPESYARKERGEIQFKLDEMFKVRNYFKLPIEQIFLPSDFEIFEQIKESNSK